MDLDKYLEEAHKMIESLGGYSAVQKRLMMQKVFFTLNLRAKRGVESVSFVRGSQILDFLYSVDLFTETGIARLRIPPYSCFELKEKVVTDTVFRINKFASSYKENHPDAKVYLLYQEEGMLTEQVRKEAKKQKLVELFQVDEFLEKIEKVAKTNDQIERFDRDWRAMRESIVDSARFAFREYHCTFFLGAGVSKDAGGPSWEELLRKIVRRYKRLGRQKDFDKVYESCGMSPIILGRYVASNKKRLDEISEYLRRYVLYKNITPEKSELIKAICEAVKGPAEDERIVSENVVDSIITYNYDDLVETMLEKNGVPVARIYLKSKNKRNEFPVYHVHGLIAQDKQDIVSTPILGEKEYHQIYKETYQWSNVEQLHSLDRNTCFFIGMSMTDPNLRRLLDISRTGSDNDYKHYAFLQRKPLFKTEEVEKNQLHFDTIEYQLSDLGVQVIWFEEFAEVPQMIRRIIAPMRLV